MALTTLRGRMVAVTVLVATVLMAVLVLLTQVFLARANHADAHSLARARASGVAASLRVPVPGGRVHVADRNEALDRLAWVYDARGRLVDGAIPHSLGPVARSLARSHAEAFRTRGAELLYARPVRAGHRTVGAVVASVDLTPYERAERRGLWVTLALGAVTVLVAGVVAHVATRRALGAVHRMAATADAWQEHDLERRFGLGPPVDELTELGRTLDRMLDRISRALHAERRLTDEVAHELRTPLTVIRAEAQLAQRWADPAAADGLATIIDATRAVEASIGTLLGAARARQLGEADADVTATLSPLLDRSEGPATSWGARSAAQVAVPPELLRAMAAPIIDNAVRHARSRVRLHVERGDPVLLHVLDDGPGIAPEDVESVFAAGWSGRDGGTGLGLSVVRRLATSAGATVRAVADGRGHLVLELPPSAGTSGPAPASEGAPPVP